MKLVFTKLTEELLRDALAREQDKLYAERLKAMRAFPILPRAEYPCGATKDESLLRARQEAERRDRLTTAELEAEDSARAAIRNEPGVTVASWVDYSKFRANSCPSDRPPPRLGADLGVDRRIERPR